MTFKQYFKPSMFFRLIIWDHQTQSITGKAQEPSIYVHSWTQSICLQTLSGNNNLAKFPCKYLFTGVGWEGVVGDDRLLYVLWCHLKQSPLTCSEFSLCPFHTMEYIPDYYPIPPPFIFHALKTIFNIHKYTQTQCSFVSHIRIHVQSFPLSFAI